MATDSPPSNFTFCYQGVTTEKGHGIRESETSDCLPLMSEMPLLAVPSLPFVHPDHQ